MKILIIAITAVILSSCAHPYYVRPGGTNVEFQKDYNDCLVKANQAGYAEAKGGVNFKRNDFINQCIYGQGWTRQN